MLGLPQNTITLPKVCAAIRENLSSQNTAFLSIAVRIPRIGWQETLK
jgi:hypothetical protein